MPHRHSPQLPKMDMSGRVSRLAPDPRLRPFRAAAYGIHTTVAAAFCIFITWNVLRSVKSMTPPRVSPVAGVELPVAECVTRAQDLWQVLEGRRQALGTQLDSWASFRVEWLKRLRTLQAECSTGSGNRAQVSRVLQDLERLEDLYTTHAVQYVGEIGPSLEQFRQDIAATR